MQRQHEHGKDVFPEEGVGEEILAEDHLFPDRAGDHDAVEGECLGHDRGMRQRQAFSCRQVPYDEHQAGDEDDELQRGENALNQCPARAVTQLALLRRVERGALDWLVCLAAHPAGVTASLPSFWFSLSVQGRIGAAKRDVSIQSDINQG